ncbi:MAG: hypothetical protein ACHQPI_04735 [Thermoanaerobaculia bacterium]
MALFGGKKDERGLRAGFRDMKWGESPRPGMQILEESGEDRFYTITGDDLEFGGTALNRIIYKYYQNRLSEVQLEIPPASVEPVFRHLSSEWGKPAQPNRFIEDFSWQNDKQGVEGTVALFSKNPNTRAAVLQIQSRYIQTKRALVPPQGPAKA